MRHRICLFGLPRCGSQYIAELIINNSDIPYVNCVEPYTIEEEFVKLPLPVNKNGTIMMNDIDGYKGQANIAKRIAYIDEVFQNDNKQTPLLVRLFPYPTITSYMTDIVSSLRRHNFTFYILRRMNYEYHALSWLISEMTKIYQHFDDKPFSGRVNLSPNIYQRSKWLMENSINFLEIAKSFGINGSVITYENCEKDLEKILDKKIDMNTRLKKQSPSDPYFQIINKDEVRRYLLDLINNMLKAKK